MSSTVETATAIRPFAVDVRQEVLAPAAIADAVITVGGGGE